MTKIDEAGKTENNRESSQGNKRCFHCVVKSEHAEGMNARSMQVAKKGDL